MPNATAKSVLASVAGNVHRLRLGRGLTQEGLAERADLALRYLQRIERGSVNISVSVLVSLAGALRVKPAELLRATKVAHTKVGRPRKPRLGRIR